MKCMDFKKRVSVFTASNYLLMIVVFEIKFLTGCKIFKLPLIFERKYILMLNVFFSFCCYKIFRLQKLEDGYEK